MKLQAKRFGALAFRAGERAHQKRESDAVGVRARRKPSINICGREVAGIDSLAAQQPN
jgi:hypothetical protein